MNGVVEQVRSKIPSRLPEMDQSTLMKLKEQALARARQLQEQACQIALHQPPPPLLVPRDLRGWPSALRTPLTDTLTQAVLGVTDAAAHTNAVARDVASSKDRREAQRKLWAVWRQLEFGTWAMRLARALVCMYFLNLCWDDVETYRYAPCTSTLLSIHFHEATAMLIAPCRFELLEFC